MFCLFHGASSPAKNNLFFGADAFRLRFQSVIEVEETNIKTESEIYERLETAVTATKRKNKTNKRLKEDSF